MTTTAIGIILFSTLFSLLNMDRKIEPVKIEKVIEKTDGVIIHPETKTKQEVVKKPEIKKEIPKVGIIANKIEEKPETLSYQPSQDYSKFYTENATKERVKNAEYIVRDDNYIPNTIEPFDEEKPYIPALLGDIANEYLIYFDTPFEDGIQKVIEMENQLGYKILYNNIDSSNTYIFIKIKLLETTAKEVENVKNTFIQMVLNGTIDDFTINSGPLPEYSSKKYIDIWQQSSAL